MSDPISWIKGDNILYSGHPDRGDRYVYLVMSDQGGYESVYIGYLHGEFRDTEPDDKKWLAIAHSLDKDRDPEGFMRSYCPPLVPWLRIPVLGTDEQLRSYWNICAWAELPLPVWNPPVGFYHT